MFRKTQTQTALEDVAGAITALSHIGAYQPELDGVDHLAVAFEHLLNAKHVLTRMHLRNSARSGS